MIFKDSLGGMNPKLVTILSLVMAASVLLKSQTAQAHLNDNIKPGSDIFMKELRWPAWDAGTYYATWYARFTPKGKVKNNFYGGVRTRGPKGQVGMFWTYWGDIRGVSAGRQFSGGSGYGAEGAKGGYSGRPDFMRPGSWYRFVIRVYKPKDKEKAKTSAYAGWWIKDVKKGIWYHHSTVELMGPATGLESNGGFVEAMANGPKIQRVIERRLGYGRMAGGDWYKADGISTNLPQRVSIIENGTVARVDSLYTKGKKPADGWIRTPNQPDKPKLDPVIIENPIATGFAKQVSVTWLVPNTSSPQMGHRIEVFSQSGAKGKPILVDEENANFVYGKRYDLSAPAKSVRLTVIDIFDQEKSVILPVNAIRSTSPAQAANRRGYIPGLTYQLYEAPGNSQLKTLADWPQIPPTRKGIVSTLDHSVRQARRKNYAMKFSGYLKAPADGVYIILAGSSDGSRLQIDGKTVMTNDGVHGSTPDMYSVSLSRGLHPFQLEHFVGSAGKSNLVMRWEGPGFARREFTSQDFMCDNTGGYPSFDIAIQGSVTDGKLKDNLTEIHAKARMLGHKPTQVQLFADRKLIASTTDLSKDGNAVFKLLLPEGKRTLWARLWYDDGNSVNSNSALDLEVTNYIEPGAPWKIADFGENIFPLGARFKGGVLQFAGEGVRFGYQAVEGDFTFTGHIKDMPKSTKENGIAGHNWIGLLIRHGDPQKSKRPYEMGSDMGIFMTAGRGVREAADFPDLGGGNMSRNELAKTDRPWMRIVRRGQRYESFLSKDGKVWEKIAERTARFGPKAYVGVTFRSVPGKSRTQYAASVDQLSIKAGAPPVKRATIDPKLFSLTKRITAVVQSADGKLLLARSTAGLFKSTDGGAKWLPANGSLKGEALAVRSVAIHPKNPSIILRAGGRVAGGKLTSGLWKSSNGGSSWKLVTRDIDFNGGGPTTLFGEVIAFNPTDPNQLVAAGETKGVFLSLDTGDTWKAVSLAGERVTALHFSDIKQYGRDQIVLAGTIDDQAFATLGMPKPYGATKSPGRIHWGTVGGKDKKLRFKKVWEMPAGGVTNLVVGPHMKFATAATTHGIYFTWLSGRVFSQRRIKVAADTLIIGLGIRPFSDWSRYTAAAPFAEPQQTPVFYSKERGFRWLELQRAPKVAGGGGSGGKSLTDGITCVLPDIKNKKVFFLCNRHGIFKSSDEGRSYKLVKGS